MMGYWAAIICLCAVFVCNVNCQMPPGENWCIANYGIGICGSSRVAGAIDYLAWGGMQFINKWDHGRELQIAISNQSGECYNPTEAGSWNDDTGPTSSSNLAGLSTAGNIYRTTSYPAFWLAPGQADAGCGHGINNVIVSPFRTSKAIIIGYQGYTNAILYELTVVVPMAQSYLQVEAPTGYLNQDTFSSFWSINLATGVMSAINGGPGELPIPVVIGSPSQTYAMGAYMARVNGQQYVSYARFDFPNPVAAAATSKWSVVYRANNLPAGYAINVFSVICLGSLQATQNCMFNTARTGGYVR